MAKNYQLFKISESFKGFIYGVIATMIGFTCAIGWDTFKYERESHQREQSLLSAVHEEFAVNLEIIKENQNVIHKDIALLKARKYAVKPLRLLQTDSLKLLIDAPPQSSCRTLTFCKLSG